jgi:hypothetical protein
MPKAGGRAEDAVDRAALPAGRAAGPGGGLKRALDYMAGHDGVWFATRLQIAEHWAEDPSAPAAPRPSEMDRATFVEAFGGIFEHSPWIAEAAHGLELGPAHDTAGGCIRARPGLSRRPARASGSTCCARIPTSPASWRRQTPDRRSTAEQAGAGLDALTDAERATFTG